LITQDEFKEKVEKGEKLVILDNLVLDVTGYSTHHPGGKYFIE
jgi:cytochrome b involved in lipid metabolism